MADENAEEPGRHLEEEIAKAGVVIGSNAPEDVGGRLAGIFERTGLDTFVCPRCGETSYNANDVREGYCGRCHDWTGVDAAGQGSE